MVAELATLETEVMPPSGRKIGRPTLYSPERAEAVLSHVRRGLSPTRAAAKCNLSHSTISEWREQYPEFSTAVNAAEAEYVEHITAKLESCQTKWETPDPKALELLSRRFPEFRQHQEVETRSVSVNVSVTVAPEQLAGLQAMWQQSLEGAK